MEGKCESQQRGDHLAQQTADMVTRIEVNFYSQIISPAHYQKIKLHLLSTNMKGKEEEVKLDVTTIAKAQARIRAAELEISSAEEQCGQQQVASVKDHQKSYEFKKY